ncbi:porin, partial [Vibrio alginolyticus]
MKMTRTSIAIAALFSASAANSAVVYEDQESVLNIHGRAQGMYYFSDDKNADGDNSYIRVGL